jgi:ribosomal-protein-alanine N-acetyltransferase
MVHSHRTGPETARLLHRAMTADDAEAFLALNSDPDVMRYTGEPLLTSLDAAREALANYPDFDTVGYGRWACVLKETGQVIGFCGLKWLDDVGEVDVGYRLMPEFWGRGLASEACAASVAFGFDVIGLESIVGFVLPDNAASIRVLEKCGLRRDGELIEDGFRALRYVVDKPRSGAEA